MCLDGNPPVSARRNSKICEEDTRWTHGVNTNLDLFCTSKDWSRRQDSHLQHSVYKTDALLLSYTGKITSDGPRPQPWDPAAGCDPA